MPTHGNQPRPTIPPPEPVSSNASRRPSSSVNVSVPGPASTMASARPPILDMTVDPRERPDDVPLRTWQVVIRPQREVIRGRAQQYVARMNGADTAHGLEEVSWHGFFPFRGASPLGLPYTLSRAPLRRRAPFAWLTRWRSFASFMRPLVLSRSQHLLLSSGTLNRDCPRTQQLPRAGSILTSQIPAQPRASRSG